MRGITAWGSYLPFRRLDRAEIAAVAGKGGGRGTRTVASFDEDPTTMAVEAGRRALGGASVVVDTLLFGSVNPAYADKTNATAVHSALRLSDSSGAFDLGFSTRSAVAGLLLAASGTGTTMVAAADIRVGRAGSADEAAGGDAGTAIVIGNDVAESPVLAEIVGTASRTAEFIDRWRTPGEPFSKMWDDKFAQVTYTPLAVESYDSALVAAGVGRPDVSSVAVSGPTARIAGAIANVLGAAKTLDDLSSSVGQCGAAQPALLLAHLLESSSPGDVVALVSLADGVDTIVLRITDAIVAAADRRGPTVAAQAASGAPVRYGKFLAWRGLLEIDPPRRPEPQRVSATAAARSDAWKFGFVASVDPSTGDVAMPPARVSNDGERVDEMVEHPMSDAAGTIVTFTIDRVAYSPSPPIVFAVVDFDGGGRLPLELCDCDEDEVEIGARVEMTFRRLYTVDGIPNYFWKARLARG
ncbi:MAG: OB-fold domain-containing protein [Acidimicrobiia bacterium]|nr:OB-fold domain-containing protein [Acidimicrobiia bacterium]